MRLLVALAGCALALVCREAAAQDAAQIAAFDQAVEEVLDQQRALLTCSLLDPQQHDFVLKAWDDSVRETIRILDRQRQISNAAIRAYQAKFDSQALIMADATFAEVIAFCRGHADWVDKANTFDYVTLEDEANRIFNGKTKPADDDNKDKDADGDRLNVVPK